MKELPINQIVCGDALEVMKSRPAESIDMCMTSPPYWGLRDYGIEQVFGGDKNCEHEWNGCGKSSQRLRDPKNSMPNCLNPEMGNICLKCQAWRGQLGLEPTVDMYIEHMTEIFNEVKRVLKKEGSLWLNIGDTYGGSGGAGGDYNNGGLREGQSRYKQGETKLPPKCLCMIPERLAWSLIQNGWIFRNKIIWFKPNAMPSSVKDRFSNRWEYIFLFVKSDRPVYWTNKKTLQLVTKKPLGIKGKEGIDWEWKKVGVVNENVFNVRVRDADKERFLQKATEKEKETYGKSKLKKVSLWTAHDYYFDLDAVREPHKYDGRKDTLYKGGPKDMQIGKHERWPNPAGKNPGDVIKAERKWNEVPGQESQSIARDHAGWFRKDGSPIVDFEKGKNPGDIFKIGAETRTYGAITGHSGAVKVPGGQGWTGHPKGGGAACQKDPRWCPPRGKNPGDFWSTNTQPFPEAHFAVFPEKLCEKPIKAGCPEQVCKKCGKARVRIVEKTGYPDPENNIDDQGRRKSSGHIATDTGRRKVLSGKKHAEFKAMNPDKTIGWTSCNCDAGFEPGIVLDPFCGAGTVGVVAKKFGRRFILIDIKKEYCEMAEKRIAQVGYQMELM